MSNPRDAYVNVYIDDPDADPVEFHFATTDLPMGKDNVLYFHNTGHPGFKIHYVLQTPGYSFPLSSQALASQDSPGCPNQNTGQWDQFRATNSTGAKLVVRNLNEDEVEFGYSLFVTDGTRRLKLDPGGVNENGPRQLYSWAYVATAFVGVAVASALGVFAAQLALN